MRLSMYAPALGLILVAGLQAQNPATPPHQIHESNVDSGSLDNLGGQRVVFSRRFVMNKTAWMQLTFGENTSLPKGSFIRMTSKFDNDWQTLDAEFIAEWNMASALFNGGNVLLELVAGANTKGNRVDLATVIQGLDQATPGVETPCGADNRVPSSDKRQGRLWIGCTGWLAGPCNTLTDKMVTAGHCSTTSTRILELNVPASASNGAVRRSAVRDQYPYVQYARLSSGVGADWMVCRVSRNSTTSRTPTQTGTGWYSIGTVPTSTTGQVITITGYGVYPASGTRNSRSQTQQTNSGPLVTIGTTHLRHRADSSGGNSGGPMIHRNTGRVIGIHTHGGCTSTGGANSGTRIDRSDLRLALARVCGTRRPGSFKRYGNGCIGSGAGTVDRLCAGINTSSSGASTNTRAPNEYAYQVRASGTTTICSFQVFTRTTGARSITVGTAIYRRDAAGLPSRTPIARGCMTIGRTLGWYTSRITATLPTGNYYVSVDHSAQTTYLSGKTAGTTGRAYWRRPPFGTGAWSATGLIPRPAVRIYCCCSAICTSRNSTRTTISNTRAPNEYAYTATVSRTTKICGFSILSRSTTTSSRTVRTRIYGRTSAGTPGALLGTGIVTIGRTVGFYRSNISATVPAGRFFIAVDHSAQTTYLANAGSGTTYGAPQAFWRRPFGSGTWSATGLVPRPAYRIYCRPIISSSVPAIGNIGVATINRTFSVTLSQARPNSLSVLLLGVSKTRAFGTVPLPFDLGIIGATGCDLLCSDDVYVFTRSNSLGNARIPIPLPPISAWVGGHLYNQWYIADAGARRPLRITFSDAGDSTIGN